MWKAISSALSTLFFFAVVAFIVLLSILFTYSNQLPDYSQLAKYKPAVTTRLFAGDGQLLMEYATEKRIFVPIDKISDQVKQAFLSAEDKKFYSHSGIDYVGIGRAILGNLKNIGTGRRPSGASTITQQVAKNFLLSSEISYSRKVKEALLATRMEKAFTKNHILELYLNEIYLGNRAYGVAAAALNYFGKSLNELSLEEAAYLAALPKGPNNYNPHTKHEAALARRNWVLGRMFEDGYITEDEMITAQEKPLKVIERGDAFVKDADYFSEEVRREISDKFGSDALYEGGLIVRTTLDPKFQSIAARVFRQGLAEYDLRHGYRGPLATVDLDGEYQEELAQIQLPLGVDKSWEKAVILEVSSDKVIIETAGGTKGEIPFALMSWARKVLKNQGYGDPPKAPKDVLKKGDVVLIEKKIGSENQYHLRQLPDIEGGMIAIDPHTGKVLAIVGGFSFQKSQYNRATQAKRQTGSSFKPLVYLAGLENGYSPTDLILDAPFILDQGKNLPKWKPVNYSSNFYGLTTFRQGVEKSRNLMTVRLAQDMGMDKVVEVAKRLGVNPDLPPLLSMSLGAGETRLVDLTAAYAMMVNSGKKIKPYFIERIQDREGKTILKNDARQCPECAAEYWDNQEIPQLEDDREQLVDPLSAYQMVSILEGVAQRGTAARLRSLGRHLAGKTGTTNESKDAWFIGFSPDLVVGVYVGFDEPRTLGKKETAAGTALPIFHNFMKEALKDQADIPFRIPAGIKLVRINYETGKPATPQDTSVILEALRPNFVSGHSQRVIGSQGSSAKDKEIDPEDDVRFLDVSDEDGGIQLGTQY